MKNSVRFLTVIGIVAVIMLGTATVFAGTTWIPFSGELPRFQDWKQLATDTNLNHSDAQAQIFSIGGDYKMNMNVYDIDVSPATKVSKTYLDADEGMH